MAMSKKLQVELVTPERMVFTREAQSVVLPGLEGSFGVWPGHLPFLAALKPGMMVLKSDEQEEIYALGGGYAEVALNKIVILADTAERADDIDLEAAQREKNRALAQLKKGIQGAEMEGVEISLKKALARLSVASSIRYRKGQK